MYNMQPYAVTDIGHWTLGLVLFYCYALLIQFLAAKPSKSIINQLFVNIVLCIHMLGITGAAKK